MDDQTDFLEKRRLTEVARDYERRGYDVVLEPEGDDLPSFLANFRPDMIARNKRETVVIEVKTHNSLSQSKYLSEMATVIQNQPLWRFELVVTNPRSQQLVNTDDNDLLSEAEIIQRCEEVRYLNKHKHREAAVLLLWSAVEGAMRRTAQQEEVTFEKQDTLYVTKKLFSVGLLSKDQYKILQKGMKVRNALVHGYKPINPEYWLTEKIVEVVEHFLAQQGKSLDQLHLVND